MLLLPSGSISSPCPHVIQQFSLINGMAHQFLALKSEQDAGPNRSKHLPNMT